MPNDKNEVTVLKKEQFPANSHASKQEKAEEERKGHVSKPVVQAGVTQKKRSFGKRFAETFLGEDVDSVGSYILLDVLIPAIRDTIVNIVQSGIEMLIYGDSRGGVRRNEHRSYYNYSTSYRSNSRDRDRAASYRNRRSNSIEDIVCEEKRDADEVIDQLLDLIDRYGQASVADLYDLVGITSSSTDWNWGWFNLSSATTRRVSGGYLIDLPKPQPLD